MPPAAIFWRSIEPSLILALLTAFFLILRFVIAFALIFAVVTAFAFSCGVPTLFFATRAANAAPPASTRNSARVETTFA